MFGRRFLVDDGHVRREANDRFIRGSFVFRSHFRHARRGETVGGRASAGWARERLLSASSLIVIVASGLSIAGQRAVARPGPPAKMAWAINLGAWGRPAADATMAFFLTATHDVIGVSAANGGVVWRQATGDADPPVGTGIVLNGETVVAGDYDLTAFDRSSGRRLWKFAPREGFAPGASLGEAGPEVVLAGSSAARVHAVDLQSGQPRWTALLTPNTNTHVYGPIITGDLVVAAYTTFTAPTTGGVVALDFRTGEERWHVALP